MLVNVHLPSRLRPGGRSDRAPAIRSSHSTPPLVTQAEVPFWRNRVREAADIRFRHSVSEPEGMAYDRSPS
jgi:hypothetical protein